HARFDARARTYHYYIYMHKSPFLRHYAAHIPFLPDFAAMNEAAGTLLGEADFTSFSKKHADVKTRICRVSRACWVEAEHGLWRFEITADRFLRGMVRIIVGTLLDVGRGKLTPDDFRQILARRDRSAASDPAPPNALFLVDVQYPDCDVVEAADSATASQVQGEPCGDDGLSDGTSPEPGCQCPPSGSDC
ncbi:MAG: hypothetical protein IJ729_01280, partial [Alloprevotella sp.]|nr:hypothetical protein [Alloprevotella sp.]